MATLNNDVLSSFSQHQFSQNTSTPIRTKDLSGQRVGQLVVQAIAHRANGKIYWLCLCDCGNTRIASGDSLRRHHINVCNVRAHDHAHRKKDLTEKRFGNLAITKTFWKEGIRYIQAICDCGNRWEGTAKNVVKGSTVSCGCWRRRRRQKEYRGQPFGLLTVQKVWREQRRSYAEALCVCGNLWQGRISDLVTGKTSSCGCLRERTPLQKRENDRIHYHRYRARKRALPDSLDTNAVTFLFQYWQFACAICGREAGGLFHVLALDHWIPLSNPTCPGTVAWNILPLCHAKPGIPSFPHVPYCNNSKAAQDPVTWLKTKLGPRKANAKLRDIETYFALTKSTDPGVTHGSQALDL
jgi:hypothetical protein